MTTPIASCPSKIIVAGEYAVLEGGEAVVVAVDRRAHAFVGDNGAVQSPYLRAVTARVAEEVGIDHAAARAAARTQVDSTALYHEHQKLGLGSSAASCVAAAGAALIAGGEALDLNRVAAIAHHAHYRTQLASGAGGSGVDVAASIYGGVIAARSRGAEPCTTRRLPGLGNVHMRAVWTGVCADTRELVAAVMAFGHRCSSAFAHRCKDLGDAAVALADALERGSAKDTLAATRNAADAIAALGMDAALPLVTDEHRRIAALAHQFGGVAKSTGAGGGDLALALFDDGAAAQRFEREARNAGLIVPPLGVATQGLCREITTDS